MYPIPGPRPVLVPHLRVALLTLLLLFLAVPATAQMPPPDYSGTWTLTSTGVLPDDGGICSFEGFAQVSQIGTALGGTATLTLVDGPDGCPSVMMAGISGDVDGQGCVEMGNLLGGELFGQATFVACPGEAADSLVGSFQVTGGPFGGGSGDWQAQIDGNALAIPTLSALGLAALVTLLMVAGALLARRRGIV